MRSGSISALPGATRDVEELLAERRLDISYETVLGAKVRPPDRATAAPASPWAERSLTIDHAVGAANYRSLHDDEPHETRYRRDAVDLGDVSACAFCSLARDQPAHCFNRSSASDACRRRGPSGEKLSMRPSARPRRRGTSPDPGPGVGTSTRWRNRDGSTHLASARTR